MRALAVLLALCSVVVDARQQSPITEFDVVSIKRTTTTGVATMPRGVVGAGQWVLTNATVQTLVLLGYQEVTQPAEVVGLPPWAKDGYDVVAKGRPNPTATEFAERWRRMATDRLKLRAHYEMRERDGYKLVVAQRDGRLGPRLRPSVLDCDKPPSPLPRVAPDQIESAAMESCMVTSFTTPTGQSTYSGGTPVTTIVNLLSEAAARPVVDATGFNGNVAFSLTYARDPLAAGSASGAPTIFTAVEEQLGLKLQSARVPTQVLVIDHIERPTEN